MSTKTSPPFIPGAPGSITIAGTAAGENAHSQKPPKKSAGHKKHTMIKRPKQSSDAAPETVTADKAGGNKNHSSHAGSAKTSSSNNNSQKRGQQGRKSAKKEPEGETEFTVEGSFIEEDEMEDEGWNVELGGEHGHQQASLSALYRYSQHASEELHAQCEADADGIIAGIASELGLNEDQVTAAKIFGEDLKRLKCADEFESEYTSPRRASGLPAAKEKELSLLDERIRDIKRQIKLARNGTHPELIAAFKDSEAACRVKEDVADILLQIQVDALKALCDREKKSAETEAEAEKNAEREEIEASSIEKRHKPTNERSGGDPNRVLRNRKDKNGGQTAGYNKTANKRKSSNNLPDYPLRGTEIQSDLNKIARGLSSSK